MKSMTTLPRELLSDDPIDCVSHRVASVREARAAHEQYSPWFCDRCSTRLRGNEPCSKCQAEDEKARASLDERIAAAKAGRDPAASALLPDPRPQPKALATGGKIGSAGWDPSADWR